MSEEQYSSPPAAKVSRAKWSAREAGDLANGSTQQGQYEPTDTETGYTKDVQPQIDIPT